MPPVDPSQIGWLFVQQYYTFMNESPERLHLFYNANSTFSHGTEGETVVMSTGQEMIAKEIQKRSFVGCQVYISSVESMPSMSGGVMVQVLGEIANNKDICKKFCQTFFLAEQPDGFYVLNDIFRTLKEDTEPEEDVAKKPKQRSQSPKKVEVKPKSAPVKTVKPIENVPVPVSVPTEEIIVAAAAVVAPVAAVEVAKPQSWSKVVASPLDVPLPAKKPLVQTKSKPPLKPNSLVKKVSVNSIPSVPLEVTESDGFQDVISKHRKEERPAFANSEKTNIYIRSVPESMEKKQIQEAYEKFGTVVNVDIPTGKGIAFVAFKTVQEALAAIGKTVVVNGVNLIAEERKKAAYTSGKRATANGNGNSSNIRKGKSTPARQQQK